MPVIGIPFYLADPQLAQIEQEIADELEDDDEIDDVPAPRGRPRIQLRVRAVRVGDGTTTVRPVSRPYRDEYRPSPFSRDYVRHIAGWYAQKHPDEDFAETFAVWLTPNRIGAIATRAWRALAKLRVRRSRDARDRQRAAEGRAARADLPVEEMTYTVEDYYSRFRREPVVEVPRWFDGDLRQLFEESGDPAAPLLRTRRRDVVDEITYWTGVQSSVVRSLVDHLIGRVDALSLRVDPRFPQRYLVSFTAMVTTLALNYLHHEAFAPSK